MRVRAERSSLMRALKTIGPAVPRISHLPVLSGVRLDAGGGLVLTATDLSLCIETNVAAEVIDDGVAIVGAGLLSAFVRSAPDGAVDFQVADDVVNITCGDVVMSMPLLRVDDWPQTPVTGGKAVALEAETLAAAARISFAAVAESDTRDELKGVWFADGHAVATDHYRLAAADLGADLTTGCVPATVLRLVGKEAAEGADLGIDGKQATVTTGETAWTTRLIHKEVPPWKRMFEDEMPYHLTVEPGALREALKRMALVGDRVRLTLDGDKLRLHTIEVDHGEISEHLTATGDLPFDVVVTIGFLADAVDAHDADDLSMRFRKANTAFTIQGERIAQVIMPIRS